MDTNISPSMAGMAVRAGKAAVKAGKAVRVTTAGEAILEIMAPTIEIPGDRRGLRRNLADRRPNPVLRRDQKVGVPRLHSGEGADKRTREERTREGAADIPERSEGYERK
jgi:hypothetical protein